MDKVKVLFVGESWFYTKTETKGVDHFSVSGYETEIERVRAYMGDFAEITHIPAHLVPFSFPNTVEALKEYDVVLISDVGFNTFILHPDTFNFSIPTPNLADVIRDYTAQGGAFGMLGGYMTFMGFEGKGKWKGSSVEEILPVTMMDTDDRCEHPEGIYITLDPESHPLLNGMPEKLPFLLGYNKLIAKENAEVLISFNGDPILAVGTYGKGKTFAWASDCAPHWMPAAFCESEANHTMWKNLLTWAVTP